MAEQMIGIIGGSGLYNIEGIKDIKTVAIDTPFGKPSDNYTVGTLEGRKVAFLPRHGKGHTILPSELNFRANIYGMKNLGVEHIIAVSAVGSMKGGNQALRYCHSRPVFRQNKGQNQHILRRGDCWTCKFCRSGM